MSAYVAMACSNYAKLSLDKAPEIVRSCVQFLQSEAVFLILSNLTGLKLHRLAITSPDSDDEETAEQAGEPSTAHVGQGNVRLFILHCFLLLYLLLLFFFIFHIF